MFAYLFHAGTILYRTYSNKKTRTTVLYKNDKGIKLDFCLKTAYMWLFIGHEMAAGKPPELDLKRF